jgi:hypothetical protein
LFVGIFHVSEQKYATKTGSLKFEATVDSFEEVTAENKNTSAILEKSTEEIAVLTLMKGFRFKEAFDIEIPKLVSKKVSDKIKVSLNLPLTKL